MEGRERPASRLLAGVPFLGHIIRSSPYSWEAAAGREMPPSSRAQGHRGCVHPTSHWGGRVSLKDMTSVTLVLICLPWEGWREGGRKDRVHQKRCKTAKGGHLSQGSHRVQVMRSPAGWVVETREGRGRRQEPSWGSTARPWWLTGCGRVRKGTWQFTEHLQRRQQWGWRSAEWHPSKSKLAPQTRRVSPQPLTDKGWFNRAADPRRRSPGRLGIPPRRRGSQG